MLYKLHIYILFILFYFCAIYLVILFGIFFKETTLRHDNKENRIVPLNYLNNHHKKDYNIKF